MSSASRIMIFKEIRQIVDKSNGFCITERFGGGFEIQKS